MTGYEMQQLRRQTLGLTQAQLGTRLGVHRNTIRRWEGRATVPPLVAGGVTQLLTEHLRQEDHA